MEFYESQAIYLQIADLLCENILQKKFKVSEKIPSVRQLAVELEVNPNTVMRTYTYLQEQNIIFNKRGIGYFVTENGAAEANNLLKSNFFKNEVPRFIKTMDLLKLKFSDLKNPNSINNENQ